MSNEHTHDPQEPTGARLTEAEILATVEGQCWRPELQVAHDRMMLCKALPETDEYHQCWRAYIQAGGDCTMVDSGIDAENWKRHRQEDVTW